MDLGMRGDGVVLASLDLGLQGYDERAGRAFYREVVDRARTIPGVQSASVASPVPLDFSSSTFEVVVEGREAEPGREAVGVSGSVVGADYFGVVGTPVVAGRAFSERDREDAPGVAVVNETFAKRYWPGQDPLGRRIRLASGLANGLAGSDAPWLEVVGVARDGKYRMYFEAPQPYVYLPAAQRYRGDMTLVVRTDADPAGVVAALRREVAALDAEVPLFGVRTMEEFLRDRTFAGPRLVSSLLSVFGLLGLTLAAVGIYGVMAYSVGQRTREIGVRMALGARRGDVVAMILRKGLILAALGVAAGTLAALALTRVMSGLLYGVSASDPLTYAGVAGLLALVALAACLIPARRASRVDPMVALRYE
jgi:predicted permease